MTRLAKRNAYRNFQNKMPFVTEAILEGIASDTWLHAGPFGSHLFYEECVYKSIFLK